VEEVGIRNVKFQFTGGVDGGRRWKGDVKKTLLDCSMLGLLAWKPRYNNEQTVRLTTKFIFKSNKQNS